MRKPPKSLTSEEKRYVIIKRCDTEQYKVTDSEDKFYSITLKGTYWESEPIITTAKNKELAEFMRSQIDKVFSKEMIQVAFNI